MPSRGPFLLLLLLLLLGLAAAAPAVEEAQFTAARLEGEGWRLEGLRLGLDLAGEGPPALSLRVDRLQLPGADLDAGEVVLHCPRLALYADGTSACREAGLVFSLSPWKRVEGKLEWQGSAERLALRLEGFRLGAGRLSGTLEGGKEGWQGKVKLRQLALSPLLARWLPQWSGSGRLGLEAEGSLEADGAWHGYFSLRARKMQFSDAEGLHVGESLRFSLRGKVGGGRRLEGNFDLELEQGQLYLDPFYLELDRPMQVKLGGWSSLDGKRLHLHRLEVDRPGLLHLSGRGDWRGGVLEEATFGWRFEKLAESYALLLQPLLIGTPADVLQLAGSAEGEFSLGGGEPRALELELRQVKLEDEAGRFGFDGLSGSLSWAAAGEAKPSRLEWRSAHFYRVALGPATVNLQARGGEVEVSPFSLELLDGRLALSGLRFLGLPSGPLEAAGGARLEKLSLAALSRALEWPSLEGELNATLPRLHYREGRLQLEGELVLELFGGRVVVEGLVIEDLLGPAPVLRTSLRLENLDLVQISRTFSFGRIEGSLEGYVRNLRLVGWEVAAFEVELRSPARDRRRHRISQRAIDNLTELGNGVASGLSGTFLGIFKDFAYDRLELRVKLEGDTAELDGAPGPAGGYYIVKGALLPRVDVIGRNRRVAWKDLLARLRNIQVKGIVVE